jgi:beta-galactosidase
MIPNHGAFSTYVDARLTQIPMLVGWNLYQGWYGGELSGFGGFLDRHKRELPDKPLLVTEYGGGADPRLRSFQPERFDFSVEYNNRLHQVYLDAIMERPFVAVSMVWNFADFNSETRVDAVPNMNNKGLLAWDRVPKDSYFLYHAYLHKEPFMKIPSSNWKLRSGMEDSHNAGVCTQPLEVYSNLDSVALYLDNKKIEKSQRDGVVHSWLVPFRNGKNEIIAKAYKNGEVHHDFLTIDFKLQKYYTNDEKDEFIDLSISLGDKRYLVDEEADLIWLPGKEYRENNWGNTGGKAFVMKNTNRQPYGSDIQIYGTEYDPVFQTKLEGLDQYRFDVVDGYYEIILHFAELNLPEAKEVLPYNLDTETNMPEFKHRAFNVYLNDSLFLKNLSTRSELIPGKAFSAKTTMLLQNNEGLIIDFEAIKGLPFLNAIQIRRIL